MRDFEGKTLLVDASCLLHKGLFGCADKLATGQDTQFYIGYVNKYVRYLLAHKCQVVLVFDGRPLPAKKETNDSRRECRGRYQQLGEQLLSQGLAAEAFKAFSRGTELTRDVVQKTIRAFSNTPMVDVIVAPYEADAQIAFLMQMGMAHAVITEDSDLIVFGCEKILFKMNPTNGHCLVFSQQRLPNCVCPVLKRAFKFDTFRRICILAGCDYLQGGLRGVGLKGAEEIFAKTNQPDLKTLLPRLPLYLSKRLRSKLDRNFVGDFIRAENTFLHQVVFDPLLRRQVPLNAYPEPDKEDSENCWSAEALSASKYSYAGKIISPQKALRLALGNDENQLSRPKLEDEFILPLNIPSWSIWHEQYKSVVEREKSERERRINQQFGAFRPSKSPVKRPAATPLNLSSISNADIAEMEEKIELATAKRPRFSLEEQGPITPANGCSSHTGWARQDWMRMYGVGKQEEQEKGQRTPRKAADNE